MDSVDYKSIRESGRDFLRFGRSNSQFIGTAIVIISGIWYLSGIFSKLKSDLSAQEKIILAQEKIMNTQVVAQEKIMKTRIEAAEEKK